MKVDRGASTTARFVVVVVAVAAIIAMSCSSTSLIFAPLARWPGRRSRGGTASSFVAVSAFIPSVSVRHRLQHHGTTAATRSCTFGPRRRLFATTVVPTSTPETTAAATSAKLQRVTKQLQDDDNDAEEMVLLPTNENDDELLRIRHSCAHVMAMAVQRTFPEAQVTIGPWIDNGFYYDFYFPPVSDDGGGEQRKLTDADLKVIKKAMDKIISKDYPITCEEVSKEEASKRIEELGEPFKMEILNGIVAKDPTAPITLYHIGTEWWDLCAGPHVTSTGCIPKKAVQLQNAAGAYWRGDEKNGPQLQRVYGTAWKNVPQLKQYKKQQEEAKKRDHRMLGTKLDLFSIQQQDAGGGLVFWHPRGSAVRRCMEDFWKDEHTAAGYDVIYTPHMANLDLWKTSGHADFYSQDMFKPIAVNEASVDDDSDQQLYQIKPMNCPFHCLLYKDQLRSYRDLPLRWAELGTVYRYERSGTLHGLFRVRGFTQDDAHIFCLRDQLLDEIVRVLDLTETILSRFGFDKYDIMLSTRPEKAVGSDDIWESATAALEGALQRKGWEYTVDEGGGAFYGPKIDLKIRDAIGRQWQCSTIQCDFNLPERFQLEYVGADGTRGERPCMVHRAIFGSIERFFGILIENTAGDFPLWLAPTQLKILPVTDAVNDYCRQVARRFKAAGIRVEVDPGKERLAKQIRNAEQSRVPLMAVVGEKEMNTETVAVRSRKLGDLGSWQVPELIQEITDCTMEAKEMNAAMVEVPVEEEETEMPSATTTTD